MQNGKRVPLVQAASDSTATVRTEGSSLPKEFAIRNIPNIHEDPPEIESGDEDDDSEDDELDDRGSNASSQSNDLTIPGLKEIVFSDEAEEGILDDDDDDDDANLKIMALLVKQENDRLEQQISRMTSYVESMEDAKLQEECLQEIELESAGQDVGDMDDRQKRARERYEKRRRQRVKEKEEVRSPLETVLSFWRHCQVRKISVLRGSLLMSEYAIF